MRVRSVRVHGDPHLGDIELFFGGDQGCKQVILLKGENGSGKSLILSAIHEAFLQSVLPPQKRTKNRLKISAKLVLVEFELDGEIHSVHIRDGYVEPSLSIAKKLSEASPADQEARDMVISYFPSRLFHAASLDGNQELQEGGISSVFPYVADASSKSAENCVILVDDLEMCLSPKNSLKAFKFLQDLAYQHSHQVIMTCRSSVVSSQMPSSAVCELTGGHDPLEQAGSLLGKFLRQI